MRNDCAIVRDLLPLYVENMVHEDTADFVKEHLLACTECSKEAELLKIPVVEEVKPEAAPLKKLKKKLLRNRIQTVLLTVLLVSTLVMAVFSYLTAPQYFPYTADLLTVRENGDGSVTVQFAEKVTGYSLYEISSPDTNSTDYHIEAWTTTWDKLFQKRGTANAIVGAQTSQPFMLYYIQNDSRNGQTAEDILLYGRCTRPAGGVMSLPGLSLWYLLLLSAMLFISLFLIWLTFKRMQKGKPWMEKLLLLPLSYAIGHCCVLGFQTTSYSEQRDFSLIVVVGTLIYCAALLAIDIYRTKKEISRMEECK